MNFKWITDSWNKIASVVLDKIDVLFHEFMKQYAVFYDK